MTIKRVGKVGGNPLAPIFRVSESKTKAQHDAIEKYSSLHYDPKSAEHKKWREEQDKRINKRMSSSEAIREWNATGVKPKGLHKVSIHHKDVPWRKDPNDVRHLVKNTKKWEDRKGMSHEDMEDVKGGRLGSFMRRRME